MRKFVVAAISSPLPGSPGSSQREEGRENGLKTAEEVFFKS